MRENANDSIEPEGLFTGMNIIWEASIIQVYSIFARQ